MKKTITQGYLLKHANHRQQNKIENTEQPKDSMLVQSEAFKSLRTTERYENTGKN